MDARLQQVAGQAWVSEAIQHWSAYGAADDDPDRQKPDPLDLSVIEDLFNACDQDSPEYDEEFHRALFRDRPEWFGPDGLPKPLEPLN